MGLQPKSFSSFCWKVLAVSLCIINGCYFVSGYTMGVTFQFDLVFDNVDENASMIPICVTLISLEETQRDINVTISLNRTNSRFATYDDFNLMDNVLMFNSTSNETLCAYFIPTDDMRPEDTECFYFQGMSDDMDDEFLNEANICINDNDGAMILLQSDRAIREDSNMTRNLCASLNMTSILERNVTLDIAFNTFLSSPFASMSDFTLLNYNLTFNPYNANEMLCAEFSPVDDDFIEDNEIFYFTVTTQNERDSFIDGMNFTQSIYDDEVAEFVVQDRMRSIEETDMTGNNLDICINLTSPIRNLQRFIYINAVPGCADEDNTATSCNATAIRTLMFSSMSRSVLCVTVEIQGDDIVEGTESFDVVFVTSEERVYITYNTTTVNIIDDDGAVLELLPTENIFENSTMQRNLCVRLADFGEGLERSIHLNIMFLPNLAYPFAEMRDFMIKKPAIYFNSSSAINDTECFVFKPVDDGRVEANERFTFNVSLVNPLDMISNNPFFDITIYDDDGAIIQLESTSNITEDSIVTREFCATLNTTELERAVVVNITFDASQSSAFAQSSDFVLSYFPLTFNSSNADERLCGIFDPLDDDTVESNELFTFEASAGNSLDYFEDGMSIFQLYITDNDGAILEIIPPDNIFESSNASLKICIRIRILFPLQRLIHASIRFIRDVLSFAEERDFMLDDSTIYFNSSSMDNDMRCFIFSPVDDDRVEANETFSFNVSTRNELDIISNGPIVDVTIYDDDGLLLANQPVDSITEDSNMTRPICIEAAEDRQLERSVTIMLSPRTTDDYNILEMYVSFLPGYVQIGNTTCFTMRPVNEELIEDNEIFEVIPSTGNSLDSFQPGRNISTFEIIDDDVAQFVVVYKVLTIMETDGPGNYLNICINMTSPIEDLRRDIDIDAGCPGDSSSTAVSCNATTIRTLRFSPMGEAVMCVTVEIEGDDIVEDTETFDVVFSTLQERVYIVYNTTTVNIIDDDGAVLELLPTNNIFENSTMQRNLCVRLTDFGEGLERSIHLNIMFFMNPAYPFAEMRDFMLNSTAIYFYSFSMINDTSCIAFSPVDDDRAEADEPFYFNVSTVNDLDNISNRPVFHIAIYDDDGARFAADDVTDAMEGESRNICLILYSILERNSTIELDFQPMNYANADDIDTANNAVMFQAGTPNNTRVCFSVSILEDDVAENMETFVFGFNPDNSRDYVNPSTVSFSVMDNDGIYLFVEPIRSSVDEETSNVTELCVTTNATMLQRFAVFNIFFDEDKNMYANSDDFYLPNVTFAFNSSNIGERLCWTFTPNSDLIPENDENFYFEVRTVNPLDTFPSGNMFHLTIVDDDGANLQVEPTMNILENSTAVRQLCVSLNSTELQREVAVSLMLNATNSPFATKNDFSILGNRNFVFNSSLIGQALCIQFDPVDDDIVEDIECFTFRAAAQNQRDVFVDGITDITVCIEDDDGANIRLESVPNVFENASNVQLCASLYNTTLERKVTIEIAFDSMRSSPYAQFGPDVSISNNMIIFNSINDDMRICTSLEITDDSNFENNETFIFVATAQNPRDTFVGGSDFILTVYDNDELTIQLQPSPSDIFENSTMMRQFCAALDISMMRLEREVVLYIMFDESQSSPYARPSDFTLTNTPLTFNSSSFNETLCAAFRPVNDRIVESNENFIFAVSTSNPLDSINGSIYELTVYDDDGARILLQPTKNIFENSTMTRMLCARLDNVTLERSVMVNVEPSLSGYATLDDFYISGNVLEFNSSTADEELCLEFMPVNDMFVEDNEIFSFITMTPNQLDYFNGSMFTLTIYDDDGALLVLEQDRNIFENSTMTRQLCVNTNTSFLQRMVYISIQFIKDPNSFANESDYDLDRYTITFNSTTMSTQCFVFDPVDDSIVEGNETFNFQVSAMRMQDIFSDGISVFTLSIYDDDGVSFTTGGMRNINEGSLTPLSLCAMISNSFELEREVIITFTPSYTGFATAADFSLDPLMASFEAGTSISVNQVLCSDFQPQNDGIIENMELFNVALDTVNSLDYISGNNIFNVYIIDDDGAQLELSVADNSIPEYSNMSLELCVILVNISEGLQREISFQSYFNASGFSEMSDFELTNQGLTFSSSSVVGNMICQDFMPVQDTIVEANETFSFNTNLSNPLDMFIADSIFTVYIQDDDGVVLSPSPTQFLATIREESTMNRSLCIQLTDIGEGLERSVYAYLQFSPSQDSPFSSKDDFRILNNAGRGFPPGSSVNDTLCFELVPVNDEIIEQTESFEFEVGVRNFLDRVDSQPQLEFIIVDDDGATVSLMASAVTVTEGSVLTVCASINSTYQLQRDVTVMLISNNEDDVIIVGDDSVTFSPSMRMQMCISFMAISDGLLEVTELAMISVNMSSLVMNDNADPIIIYFNVEDADVAEVSFVNNSLTLREDSTDNTRVCVMVAGNFTPGYVLTLNFSSSSPNDINILTNPLKVNMSGEYCVYVRAINDSIVESLESHTLSVQWTPIGNTTSIPVMIIDNNMATVIVEERDLVILEGLANDVATICLSLQNAPMLERAVTGTAMNITSIQSVTISIDRVNFDIMGTICIQISASDDGSIIANDIRRTLTIELTLNNNDVFISTMSQTRTINLIIIEDDSILIEGKDYFPFINLDDNDGGVLTEISPEGATNFLSRDIFPTTDIPFGSASFNRLFVTSEGAIVFGTERLFIGVPNYPITSETLDMISVFLTNHDPTANGTVRYKVYSSIVGGLSRINSFIQTNLSVSFTGTWMVVAEWNGVPEQGGPSNVVNTYQLIIVTDFMRTYAVMTYNCDELQWTGAERFNIGAIGYTSSSSGTNMVPSFYNHPLSKRDEIRLVACSNVGGNRNRPWTNEIRLIGEVSVNVNEAQCLSALAEDEQRISSQLSRTRIFLRPCPRTFIQAFFDRRYYINRVMGNVVYFLPIRFFIQDYLANLCAYSTSNIFFSALLTTSTPNFIGSFLFIASGNFLDNLIINEPNFNLARTCCMDSNQCDRFMEVRRIDFSIPYRPPRRFWFFGDPHFETLDGANYTFNGWGEYTMLEVNDGFTIQARTTAVNPANTGSATRFSAFAFGITNATVEVRIANSDLEVLLNRMVITDTIPANVSGISGNLELVTLLRPTNSTIEATFPNDITITVSLSMGLLAITSNIPEEFAGNVSGLLGNFNNDPSDDLTFRNGTTLDLSASDREIHNFGQSWQINETTSLFTYPDNQTFNDFNFPNHVPNFLSDVVANASQEVINQCEGDVRCIFDASETGNINIGLNTMEFDMANVIDREQQENFPPTIEAPGEIQFVLNVTLSVNITVTDTNLQSFVQSSGPQDASLTKISETVYEFSWTPGLTFSSAFTFTATDTQNASAVYTPQIDVCPCLNNGSCIRGGVPNPSANPLLLNCDCTPAWEGRFCENNFNACTEGLCFPGVTCIDLIAPEEGAMCGNCTEGFVGDGINCDDINECSSNVTNPCEQGCNNLPGSFECTCFSGFVRFNDTRCRDIDECQTVGRCHQNCMNTPGSFACECNEGFMLESDDFTCAVAPGFNCSANNSCSQLCVRDPMSGSENCSCDPGFMLDSDGFSCINVNECMDEANTLCDQICTDTIGSFNCSCRSGFSLVNRTSCVDINECELTVENPTSPCPPTMLCDNTLGSFNCSCPQGTAFINEMCVIPPEPTPAVTTVPATTFPPTIPAIIEFQQNAVVFVIPSITLAVFETRLNDFRTLIATFVTDYCTRNGAQCSYTSVFRRSKRQTITVNEIIITDIMEDGNGGVTFNLYVLDNGMINILSGAAVLNAINNNRQALEDAGFTGFTVRPFLDSTTNPPPVLNGGEIAGIVIGIVAFFAIIILLLGACIYYCFYYRKRRGKVEFYTYGKDPAARSAMELRGGNLVEENIHVNHGKEQDNESMQSVQLEFTEARNDPSPQPIDPPDYDEAVDEKDKINLVDGDGEARGGLPDLDITINFMEDADKDTRL